jgi:L-ascorbate metabolism protein UlaG (beta-lactamase superfamily)
MNISWLGHACFRLESKETSLLIDPFSKDIGLRPPRFRDQIIALTHQHYDHNSLPEDVSNVFVVDGPGEYEKLGVYIQGIGSFHDNTQGAERGMNTIYVITMEDIRLCHLGDIGQHQLTNEQVEEIGDIDVLFIPIGGNYTIDAAKAMAIVGQIEPKIIVPMHYKVAGLNIDIEGPQKFLKEIGIKPEEVETYKIAAKNLPTEEIKLITFKL